MGVLSIGAGLINLEWVISAMLTGRILIQFIAQIFAVHYLRKYRTDIERPFKAWLYPVPNAIAFIGWSYIFLTSGWAFVAFGVGTLAAGVGAFWLRSALFEPAITHNLVSALGLVAARVHYPFTPAFSAGADFGLSFLGTREEVSSEAGSVLTFGHLAPSLTLEVSYRW